tara:strand:- start:33017 stop:33301 length:285 start_codon:yes stop_codon:yes gene_type:complete
MADKIAIMNYSIDVTELDYDSAKFTSMPGTKAEKKFILVLDYIENRWDLWSGHQTDWVENALISGRINHKSCIYKILPKVLRFIDDRDHEQIAA